MPTPFLSNYAILRARLTEGTHALHVDLLAPTDHHCLFSWRGAGVRGHDASVIAKFSLSICSASIKVMVVGLLWRRGHFEGKLQLTCSRCWAAARGGKMWSLILGLSFSSTACQGPWVPSLQAAMWTNIWGAGCFWNPFWIWQPEQRAQSGMEQRGVNAAQSGGGRAGAIWCLIADPFAARVRCLVGGCV